MLFDALDSSILTPILPRLAADWKITHAQIGFIASAGFLGMTFGATLFGALADAIGRLKVFAVTLLWYSVLAGLCSLSTGFYSLLTLRFIVGFGLGGLIPVCRHCPIRPSTSFPETGAVRELLDRRQPDRRSPRLRGGVSDRGALRLEVGFHYRGRARFPRCLYREAPARLPIS